MLEEAMSSLPKPRFTAEQYLALERQAEYRSEFFHGEIFAMSGASREHNLIAMNVTRELSLQLKGRPCETYASDMRVKVSATGLYTYPEVVVVCGEPQFEDEQVDTLLNPTLLVAVLSPSTEAYDRGQKSEQYRRLRSLREYVLVAQDRPHVEWYARQQDPQWVFSEVSELAGEVHFSSIGCRLALSEMYDRVKFPAEGEGQE
jgi:Uma2 family endonuclease